MTNSRRMKQVGRVTCIGEVSVCNVLFGKPEEKKLQLIPISHPDIRVKHCSYGHSVTTVSHKYILTVARYATVVVAVPSTIHYPTNCKIKIYYLR
jgi:hypothetical protein